MIYGEEKVKFFSNQEKELQERYIELLSVCASFSNLFSDSDVPLEGTR